MSEIGKRCKTDLTIEDIPKKKLLTFKKGDTFSKIINSMFDNKARKIFLEGTTKYLSDSYLLKQLQRR